MFDEFHAAIIQAVEQKKAKKPEKVDQDNDGGSPGTTASNRSEDDCHIAAASTTAEQSPPSDETPRNQGKLILDATVTEQAIRFPTDLGLLNEARELSEHIIDVLHEKSHRPQKKKPRTYREIARKAYLSLAKVKRPASKKRRDGIKKQLQFLRRNLGHIEEMLSEYPHGTPISLPNWLLRRYWVLPHLYNQQHEMYTLH